PNIYRSAKPAFRAAASSRQELVLFLNLVVFMQLLAAARTRRLAGAAGGSRRLGHLVHKAAMVAQLIAQAVSLVLQLIPHARLVALKLVELIPHLIANLLPLQLGRGGQLLLQGAALGHEPVTILLELLHHVLHLSLRRGLPLPRITAGGVVAIARSLRKRRTGKQQRGECTQ
ncbi:MAG: hypothetical protein WCL11_26575, partial [Verrucomicrobiota bacterium]